MLQYEKALRSEKAAREKSAGKRTGEKSMGKSNKVFGINGGIHFLCMGTLLSLIYLLNELGRTGRVRIPSALFSRFLIPLNRDWNLTAILSSEGGYAACILTLAVFVLIGVGLLSRKRILTIIGAGMGVLMRFLMLLGVFEVSLRNANMLARMRMHLHFITGKVGWPLLLFELLALTFFAALLLCACLPRLARLFGWIGAGTALTAILPACLVGAAMIQLRVRFWPSSAIILLGILLAAGAIFAGEALRKKNAPPQQPYRQVPPQETQYRKVQYRQ